MTSYDSPSDLQAWLTHHLDPLDEPDPVQGVTLRSDYDLSPGWGPAEGDPPLTKASVLVALVERDAGVSVIFTRRSDNLRRHKGQIAFPGGRRDPGEGAVETALREAEEEIGLDRAYVSPLGLSTPYMTGTGYLITPVVGVVRPGFTLTASPDEVADIFETPFGFLMDPINHEQHEIELPTGEKRKFYAITHDKRFIWGATAGMLRALYDRLYGAAIA